MIEVKFPVSSEAEIAVKWKELKNRLYEIQAEEKYIRQMMTTIQNFCPHKDIDRPTAAERGRDSWCNSCGKIFGD